jgi:hypothetical protein
VSRTYRADTHPYIRTRRAGRAGDDFRCRHCRTLVGPPTSGGRHRNHCPACLWSRHVDERRPGDRASPCGGSMAPAGVFQRRTGEEMLVHRCLSCGVERQNRVAADDDPHRLRALTPVAPPHGQRAAELATLGGVA